MGLQVNMQQEGKELSWAVSVLGSHGKLAVEQGEWNPLLSWIEFLALASVRPWLLLAFTAWASERSSLSLPLEISI